MTILGRMYLKVLLIAWAWGSGFSENNSMVYAQSTILIVRHAEKEQGGPDPHLSEVGKRRAERLAEMLGESGIQSCFATQYLRSQETAKPTSERLEVPILAYRAGTETELGNKIRTSKERQVVLVVVHTNTRDALLEGLGFKELPDPLQEDDYDRLYVVHLSADKQPHLLVLRF